MSANIFKSLGGGTSTDVEGMVSHTAVSFSGDLPQQSTGRTGGEQTTGSDVEDEGRQQGNESGGDLVQSGSRVQHARPPVGMETSVLFNE